MVPNSVIRFNSKRGYLIAVICLALMVVALGAAAKHSQFESPFHSTHYLKQSVKMVSGTYQPVVEAPVETAHLIFEASVMAPTPPEPAPIRIASPVPSPLLI